MDRELLAQSSIFKDLDDREMELVVGICEVLELKVGEYVFHEGVRGRPPLRHPCSASDSV